MATGDPATGERQKGKSGGGSKGDCRVTSMHQPLKAMSPGWIRVTMETSPEAAITMTPAASSL